MKFLLGLFVLISITAVSAQTKLVTVDAFDFAYTGGLLIKSDSGKGADRDEVTFKLNLNYAQSIEQYVGLMWRARAFINRQDVEHGSNDLLETSWGGAGGFLYNFQADQIKESYFAGIMVGVERATYQVGTGDDKSGFNFFTDLEFGKRFDMGQYSVASIAYAPSVGLNLKRYGGDIRDDYYRSGHELKFNFLKFDILF